MKISESNNCVFYINSTLLSILLQQDGVLIPFDADTEIKHGLKRVGKKFVFSINGVNPEDAGLYQLEIDGVKIFSTELKSKRINN